MNILFTLLMVMAFTINPIEERVGSEITFCNFELPRNVKIANASFNLIYSFEVNEEGGPIKITKVKGDYVGEAMVVSCLEGWRFHGCKKGAPLVVIFQWQHGHGWTEISITGPDFSQKIKVTGERCPYLRMQSKPRQ
jgi:hypothetical protein